MVDWGNADASVILSGGWLNKNELVLYYALYQIMKDITTFKI